GAGESREDYRFPFAVVTLSTYARGLDVVNEDFLRMGHKAALIGTFYRHVVSPGGMDICGRIGTKNGFIGPHIVCGGSGEWIWIIIQGYRSRTDFRTTCDFTIEIIFKDIYSSCGRGVRTVKLIHHGQEGGKIVRIPQPSVFILPIGIGQGTKSKITEIPHIASHRDAQWGNIGREFYWNQFTDGSRTIGYIHRRPYRKGDFRP